MMNSDALLKETDKALLSGREYAGASRIDGPLVYMRNTHPVGYNELVEIIAPDGSVRSGQVLDTSDDAVCVQCFEGTDGLNLPDTKMHFLGEPLTLGVSEKMLGRVMNGLGKSRDGAALPASEDERDVNGVPMNPTAREYPRDFIQTGISVIDGMMTLIQGQKLPIFSGNGMEHNQLAAQIVRQAKVRGGKSDFAIVFAAMGVKYDVAKYFIDSFEETGVLDNVAMFLSLADDPSLERTITPKTALTLITREIDRWKEEERKRTLPGLRIDLSRLPGIREDARATQRQLIVPGSEEAMVPEESFERESSGPGASLPAAEETLGKAVPETPSPAAETELGLTGTEVEFLRRLLRNEPYEPFLRSHGLMASILADAVNEKLFGRFGDVVIDSSDDRPHVLKEYEEELKGVIG